MITVVDYGVGNIASITNMLDFIGFETLVSGDPETVASAKKLILPGIGAFDKAMSTLEARALTQPIKSAAAAGASILGVCLGMQLLAKNSEEGQLEGLGLIDAEVVRIDPSGSTRMKIPHIGWADVTVPRLSPLFPKSDQAERFYFAHSYHMKCQNAGDVAAEIDYGKKLCVAVSRANIHGAQFHPEKSHRFGMRLLKSFAEF
jgi:imidazole glycerol-phosphate synthase subunit HisH